MIHGNGSYWIIEAFEKVLRNASHNHHEYKMTFYKYDVLHIHFYGMSALSMTKTWKELYEHYMQSCIS